MIPVSGSLVLVLLALLGFMAYTWATLPERARTDQLYAIAVQEQATAAIPATRLAQLDWLVRKAGCGAGGRPFAAITACSGLPVVLRSCCWWGRSRCLPWRLWWCRRLGSCQRCLS